MYTPQAYAKLERRAADAERALLDLYRRVFERSEFGFDNIVGCLETETTETICEVAERYRIPLQIDDYGNLIRP